MNRIVRAGLVAALLGLGVMPAGAETALSEIPAYPQRPRRSLNSRTTAPGYWAIEFGGRVEKDSFGTPTLLRFGLSPRWEIDLGLEPIVGADIDGGSETSFGDTTIEGKWRFFESHDGQAALHGFVRFPTASVSKGLGTGEHDAGFTFVASRIWDRNAFDFNLGGEFAGVTESPSNDAQWTVVLTWSRDIFDRWDLYGELFFQFLPAADKEEFTTDWGFHYYLSRSFALDAGINIGLTGDAPDYEILFGLTKVLGRVFNPSPTKKP
jgi:hypothetical protein